MEARPQVQTYLAPDTAERWQRNRANRFASMAQATNLMLDLAGIGPGCRVLDVAAGSGDQSIEAARRAGPSGYVVATDMSEAMLKGAIEAAREAGLSNIETRVVDAQELDFDEHSFDAAICRNGLMFFPDRQKALRSIRRALRPGGKLAVVVWSAADKNPWLSIPRQLTDKLAGADPQAGIALSMGEPSFLEDELSRAGFEVISVHRAPVNRHFPSLAAAMEAMRSSPAAEPIAKLPVEQQTRLWSEIEAALQRFVGPRGCEVPGESLVGAGAK